MAPNINNGILKMCFMLCVYFLKMKICTSFMYDNATASPVYSLSTCLCTLFYFTILNISKRILRFVETTLIINF